ncbi:MAG: hypothetical protein ACT4P4_00635 [Betaproteobacteria bacterium]
MNRAIEQVSPGRICPATYRYGARALRGSLAFEVDSLWVAGGLYGNPYALQALIERYEREPGSKALVFNGDFHWFDADASQFEAINDAALAFRATRGNVETELAAPASGAGCGCGYPQWVDDGTVERSNRILERLRQAALAVPDALARLAALPMHLRARVGDARVAIVHGDAESLAGWAFSQEALATAAGAEAAERSFALADAEIFASSHTCLPVLRAFAGGGVLANNGAAGMPNFRGGLFGLATRIAVTRADDALCREPIDGVFVEAVPLRYDAAAWERLFLSQWPEGSDAHVSYYGRIRRGPDYTPQQAYGSSSMASTSSL